MKKLIFVCMSMVLATPILTNSAFAVGNAAAGKPKAAACVACHGPNGNSTIPTYPKLASQNPGYIAKQLADFKSGKRKNAIMLGMAAGLSKTDMANVGAYFGEQKMTTVGATNEKLALEGEKIYRGGITKMGVGACMGCHGPSGKGINPNFPAVSGQHAAYTEAQLLAFKNGTRTNDNKVMQDIAFRMSEQQIKAVAMYMQGLTAR
jgi:cytochrome c553